jgi:hypothetical protein
MKTLGWITTAALGLGFAMATPAMAREEHGRPERNDVRVEHVDRTVEVRHDVIRHDTVVHDRPVIINRDRIIDRPVIVDRPVVTYAAPVAIIGDCNVAVAIPNLPVCVTDTITLQGRGPIDSVQYVQANGLQFYDVVCGRGAVPHFDMHIDLGGALLSLNAC